MKNSDERELSMTPAVEKNQLRVLHFMNLYNALKRLKMAGHTPKTFKMRRYIYLIIFSSFNPITIYDSYGTTDHRFGYSCKLQHLLK